MSESPRDMQDERAQEVNPADRLAIALERIAFAADRRRVAAPAAPEGPDLHMLAANLDVLIARVRNAIEQTAEKTTPQNIAPQPAEAQDVSAEAEPSIPHGSEGNG